MEFVELFAAFCAGDRFSGARRKRSRPLIAAAYPDLPDAGQSGFLLVLQLPAGPSEITIQVQDHEKSGERFLSRISGLFLLPLLVG